MTSVPTQHLIEEILNHERIIETLISMRHEPKL